MSDSFADLWNTTAPSNAKPAPVRTLGSSSSTLSNNTGARPPTRDVFAALASSGTLSPSPGPSRTITPSSLSSIPSMPPRTQSGRPAGGVALPGMTSRTGSSTSTNTSTGSDAFGNLLSGSAFQGSSTNMANMTIAQRAAQVEKDRLANAQRASQAQAQQAAAWSGLDSLGGLGGGGSNGGTKAGGATVTAGAGIDDDLFSFASSSAQKTAPPPKTASHTDDWGLGDAFSSTSTSPAPQSRTMAPVLPSRAHQAQAAMSTSTSTSKGGSLWDLDEFASPSSGSPATNGTRTKPRKTDSPGQEFDFGDREDGLLGVPSHAQEDSNDDILGVLARPASTEPPRAPRPRPQTSRSTRRPSSPPPHIIGQIVEMGFTPQQARTALSATDTGVDVQGALDALLAGSLPDTDTGAGGRDDGWGEVSNGNTNGGRSAGRGTFTPDDEEDEYEADLRRRQATRRAAENPEDAIDPAFANVRARRRPQGASSRDAGGQLREGGTDTTSSPGAGAGGAVPSVQAVQEQADKLLSQASELGLGLFNKAGAFWAQSREKVQKAYEERVAASGTGSPEAGASASAGPSSSMSPGPGKGRAPVVVKDTRPKWMQDAPQERAEDDWGLDAPARPGARAQRTQDESAPARPSPRAQRTAQSQEEPAPPSPEVDLFSSAPVRPLGASTNTASSSALASSTTSTQPGRPSASSAPRRAQSSAPAAAPTLIQRPVVSASASALATCTQHKDAGTATFKLGQYANAVESYTRALDALPEGHLLRVQVWNNRSLARLRSGDYKGALEDSTSVVELIGLSYNPALERKIETHDAGAGVDLADGLVKALKRRAEAAEGRERWGEARRDWETLAGLGWAPGKTRSEAVSGVGRCRKAENPQPPAARANASTSDVPNIRPRPKTSARPAASTARSSRPAVEQSGEALQRVQAANRAQEAEDDEKAALKDSVDARLLAWKTNKETNVRALLGSLESVLWPELGMPKVGMNNLLTEKQVKIQYTKAIGRLHPDKLNVNNTTLEQRMIANGVFAALNEAWLAFKA